MKEITPKFIDECQKICPEVGDWVYVKDLTIFDVLPRQVVFKNRYGVLVQWKNEICQEVHHNFYSFGLCEFVLCDEVKEKQNQ